MTQCYDEGSLRAYLDDALPSPERAAVAAHLAACATCRGRFEEQHGRAAQVAALLMGPAAAPDPHAALMRFKRDRRLEPRAEVESQHPAFGAQAPIADHQPQASHISRRSTMSFQRRFGSSLRRPLFVGLAVMLVMIGLLALPPVRAAADQLLLVFRVQRVVFIPTTSDRLAQLQNLNFDKKTLFVTPPKPTKQPAQPRSVASAAAASSAVGFSFQQPSVFPRTPTSTSILVHDSSAYTFQVDVNAARQLLTLMEVNDVSLPDALGAQPITANLPSWVESRYSSTNYDLRLFQGHSPTVTLPDGVDIRQLGKAALRLLGMDSQQAETLSKQIDWTSTFIFPFPSDLSNLEIRQVTVGDAQGLLVQSSQGNKETSQLYWQRGDRFYVLQGQGRINEVELIATADSVR